MTRHYFKVNFKTDINGEPWLFYILDQSTWKTYGKSGCTSQGNFSRIDGLRRELSLLYTQTRYKQLTEDEFILECLKLGVTYDITV